MAEAIPIVVYNLGKHTNSQANSPFLMICIIRNGDFNNQQTITIANSHQKIIVQEGDRIICVKGAGFFHVKPGTGATGFRLKEQTTPVRDGIRTDEITITKETTKIVTRGSVHISEDIGNPNKGGWRTR